MLRGQTFPLGIQSVVAQGRLGERFATELDEGGFVVVTVGELVYRRRDTKDGEKSGLEILVWRVQKDDTALATPAAAAPSADHVEPEPDPPRKPRLPKHLQRPWTPRGESVRIDLRAPASCISRHWYVDFCRGELWKIEIA